MDRGPSSPEDLGGNGTSSGATLNSPWERVGASTGAICDQAMAIQSPVPSDRLAIVDRRTQEYDISSVPPNVGRGRSGSRGMPTRTTKRGVDKQRPSSFGSQNPQNRVKQMGLELYEAKRMLALVSSQRDQLVGKVREGESAWEHEKAIKEYEVGRLTTSLTQVANQAQLEIGQRDNIIGSAYQEVSKAKCILPQPSRIERTISKAMLRLRFNS